MSYEVCVTRAAYSWENQGQEIAVEEWFRIASDDPTLETIAGRADAAAVWTAHPDGHGVVFSLRDGNVVPDRVDEAVIAKLVRLADTLGGRTQGDDGEVYTSPSDWQWPATTRIEPAAQPDSTGLRAALQEALLRARDMFRGTLGPKPFAIGTRVRDPLLGEGRVVGYEYGPLNNIVVELDSGRVVRRAVLFDGEDTAGLEPA